MNSDTPNSYRATPSKPRRDRKSDPSPKNGPASARPNQAREMERSLSAVAALTDAVTAEEERMAPQVSLSMPLVAIARALGLILSAEPLFRWAASGMTVTVNTDTGEMEPMTHIRFTTWAQERVTFVRETARGIAVVSLPPEMAKQILASDVFRGALRPLKGINTTRLPVWANAERTALELLPVGYHPGEAVFTVNLIPYDTELFEDTAREFQLDCYKEFPLDRPEDDPKQPLERNRNFSVQIGCALANFCRHLLNGMLRPAFIYRANQQGSGKSLIARMALIPVDGIVSSKSQPRDDAEMGKILTTFVSEGKPTLSIDNVRGRLASQELEAFLTSPVRNDRVLGKTASVTAPNNMLVVITGNDLRMTTDLARRSLLCDLFSARMVSDRKIANPVSETWLALPATRAKFLAAMWALVRYWNNRGCPRSKGATLPSFEEFSGIIGGIVTTALFADPIAKPDAVLDEVEQGWITLFKLLAADVPDDGFVEYSIDQMLEKAEDEDIKDIILGDTKALKDPKVAFGCRIRKWKGRQFHDAAGRLFEFGKRHGNKNNLYGVRILKPEEAGEE